MNLITTILIVSITVIGLVYGHLTRSSLAENVFLPKESSSDPYEDLYVQTIFQMNKKELMQIPKLDDEVFLFNLERNIDDMTGLVVIKDASMIFDDKLDEQLLSQRDIEEKWEDLVVAGPITVNYISNLMLVASRRDFALVSPTPDHVYTYIKYPNSFRATLVQVANEMYTAFLSAHTNMDRIQTNIQQIPNHLKTAIKLLTSASPRLIQTILPLTLGSIKRIASQSVESANSTIHSYRKLVGLLDEITAITLGTQGSSEVELETINDLLTNSTKEQELLNSQLELIRQQYETAREALQKAQKEYHDAYHAIPGRRKRFFGSVGNFFGGIISGVGNFIGGALNAVGCIFASCSGKPVSSTFENATAKAELAYTRLQEAQAIYDTWYAKMLEKQNKLTATIIQLSQLDMGKVDHQTIIDILVSATKEVIHIQKQWDKMIRFFSKLSIQAEHTQETILFEFIDVIEATEMISGDLDDADREFYVTLLLQTADEIDRGAHLLYIMSKTYYDISTKYMMNQIAGISGLLLTQTNEERENQMKQIAQETLSTSAKVSRMALERRQQYEQRNKERQDAYQQFIQEASLNEFQPSIGK
ncbi:unnamed protein product [Rotaria magnacalcarata]|uniref:Uncharacterized protein n=1 Tax=Rotaria magnacalcarata TaxID=392030 RepID=A0A815ZN02_9BILA|nr:unnamed protein product [Rotaria magnacalcarata]CAF1615087.1 unnamed protein product [Rotaria magnacalcarata]CAF2242929.1 unnamed protein product [Rotaria magnacalcarata]CAF4077686.1 unnamed protein product [Rotaria magnacalcarata]CAF4079749.1 unnamed protein product [Rotaria magnacalcarata]